MSERIIYLLGVVAVGWAVTFALRALPFLLFAGRDRELPAWVPKLGNVISPIIIGGLIIYSYSTLEWRTAWPYLAGALTVGLQLVWRNPLISIIAGTALYMTLLTCGCTSDRIDLDARDPSIRVTTNGVYVENELVQPIEVPEILDDFDIPKDRVIHILVEPDVRNLSGARTLMGLIARAGWTRPVLVTKRHADSEIVKRSKARTGASTPVRQADPPVRKKIRYKK